LILEEVVCSQRQHDTCSFNVDLGHVHLLFENNSKNLLLNQLVKFEVLACKIPVIPVLSLLETNCKTEERQMEYEKTEEHRANPPRQQHMKKQRRPVLVNLQTTTTKKPVETSDTFAHSPKRDQQIK